MAFGESYKEQAESKMRSYSGGGIYVRSFVVCADFFFLNLLLAVYLFGFDSYVPSYLIGATKISVLVMNIAMIVAEYFFHTIIDRRFLKIHELVVNVFKLTFAQAFIAGMSLRLLSSGGGLFRFMVIFFVVEYAVLLTTRLIEYWGLRYLRSHGRNSHTVLFVGNDPVLGRIYDRFMNVPSVGYDVLGYYADERMEKEPEGLKWLGNIEALNEQMTEWNEDVLVEPNIQELMCSLSHNDKEEILRIMHACDRNVIHFFYVPRTFEDYEFRLVPVRAGDYIFYSARTEPLLSSGNRLVKRIFDVCFSAVVCLFLIPLSLIIGLIIKIQSPGPIFFKQCRTGLDGKTFYLYKFRSMHVNKDADKEQATKDDPRKFPFGNFMRKTNIDELPQFFNVLKGDMSIVGPRPHMLYHTETYGKLIDKYMVRLFCKPGITGWAQVTGFRGETKELWQMEGRVKRDIWYVEHWSIGLDIRIILMTIKSIIIPDKNAY